MGTVLIVGGHAGLGLEAAMKLAERSQNLVFAGRDLATVEKVAAGIRMRFAIRVTAVRLNLSWLASVRAAAAQIQWLIAEGQLEPLDALLCNAGAQFRGPISYSTEGYEETFAINYLGHFLLVNLLLNSLTEHARVVLTTNGTHDRRRWTARWSSLMHTFWQTWASWAKSQASAECAIRPRIYATLSFPTS